MGDEQDAVERLLRTDGIGHARVRALRGGFGSAVAALGAEAVEFAETIGVRVEEGARMLADARRVSLDDGRALLARIGARRVLEGDARYPALLRVMPDPSPILFIRGALGAEPEPAVAIVGSRRASAYGKMQAGRLAGDLAARGVTVVSGGARGIDAEAHRAALRAGGRTIAVIAPGFGHPYPIEHAPLFEAIVDGGGALLTEQCSDVEARPDLFPRRNRMIAGLALVTVVVEAAARSGALLTARLAVDDLSRTAGCVPGPVDSVTSEGCHRAIREGWAQLVTCADDVCELLEEMRPLAQGAVERERPPIPLAPMRSSAHAETRAPPAIGSDAAEVLRVIGESGRAGFDELEQCLEWTVPRIALATLELERAGLAARDAEGAFRRLAAG